MAAGLSKALADMLAASSIEGNRWCAVKELEDTSTAAEKSGEIPIATSDCITAELEINRVVHSRGTKMRLTLVRLPSGRIAVDGLEPL